ncbi:hypothetical protein AGMMS50256_25750 [Betaproteobacteria bacterium]|nr:hypothetical protein AGMMS50256_25750 [Betaproteobacteria bacterium]
MKKELTVTAFERVLNRRFAIALQREGTPLTEPDRFLWQLYNVMGVVNDYANGNSRWLDQLIAEAREAA